MHLIEKDTYVEGTDTDGGDGGVVGQREARAGQASDADGGRLLDGSSQLHQSDVVVQDGSVVGLVHLDGGDVDELTTGVGQRGAETDAEAAGAFTAVEEEP